MAPENKYTVQEDVKPVARRRGQVQQQLPILRDDVVDDYVERVGQRLVDGIPAEFRHSEFRYTFDVVNIRDINAFALPGGPMFVNRGMIEAAKNEGEVAGVLAHEISHVSLRHGTAQAGKATPLPDRRDPRTDRGCDHRRRCRSGVSHGSCSVLARCS